MVELINKLEGGGPIKHIFVQPCPELKNEVS